MCQIAGCFYIGQNRAEDIVKTSSKEWSSRECLTILMSYSQNNLTKIIAGTARNIKVFATPYSPAIITALSRDLQKMNHWSEAEYREYSENLFQTSTGLCVDWEGETYFDGRGEKFNNRTQIDSLLFLVSIINDDYPWYIPDINDLEQNIFLVNDNGKYVRPKYVWGRQRNQLSMEETLLVMFELRSGQYHFLKDSDTYALVIKGFGEDIALDFSSTALEFVTVK